MEQINQQENLNMDAFEQAAQLRAKAQALEAKETVRRRLLELIEISKDPYYDQYLAQMMKDLESGKATPGQVSKEAERTYILYQQRMGEVLADPIPTAQVSRKNETLQQGKSVQEQQSSSMEQTACVQAVKQKDTVEFKIGAGIFSTLGAVFVLVSLVIFGFNFLEGIWQGVCLYVAAAAVILLSELLIRRLSPKISLIISAIGISSLFISTVINYLVLKNINGIVASVITLAIAAFSILYSRKKDATSVRLITFFGCYICFFPIKGFESELSFLIMMGMVFAINLASVLLPNQKNGALIGCVHMITHLIYTTGVTVMVLADKMDITYVSFFVVLSLVLLNLIYYSQKQKLELWYSVIYSIVLGFFALILIAVSSVTYGNSSDEAVLFCKYLTEAMTLAVAIVFFVLWGKEKSRWIQYYFIAAIVILFNGFTDYNLEATIAISLMFVITRFLCKEKELLVLDSILTMVMVLQGMYVAEEWYAIPITVILILSVVTIKNWHIYQEIVLTVFFLFMLSVTIDLDGKWTLPIVVASLPVMFLAFNHLPNLREKQQFPYNVVNIVFAGILSLFTIFLEDYIVSFVVMLVGAVIILIAFRERYKMNVPRKYMFLAGYLIVMILTAGYESPVMESVLLMIVSVICVGIGFRLKDKVYRIFGLIMAVLVCIKLIVFDFGELESMAKAILFLLVGIIALAISFLYIYLEKKEDEEEKEQELMQQMTQEVIIKEESVLQEIKADTEERIGAE